MYLNEVLTESAVCVDQDQKGSEINGISRTIWRLLVTNNRKSGSTTRFKCLITQGESHLLFEQSVINHEAAP